MKKLTFKDLKPGTVYGIWNHQFQSKYPATFLGIDPKRKNHSSWIKGELGRGHWKVIAQNKNHPGVFTIWEHELTMLYAITDAEFVKPTPEEKYRAALDEAISDPLDIFYEKHMPSFDNAEINKIVRKSVDDVKANIIQAIVESSEVAKTFSGKPEVMSDLLQELADSYENPGEDALESMVSIIELHGMGRFIRTDGNMVMDQKIDDFLDELETNPFGNNYKAKQLF